MNPFALPGPQFLLFYALFAIAVLLLLHFGRRLYEGGPLPRLDTKDPYLFACLGGGPAEVVRVCTVGLIDRRLLTLSGGTAHTVPNSALAFGAPQIERKVLDFFRGGASLSSAVQNSGLLAAAQRDYEQRLRRDGLIPDAATDSIRRVALAFAILALVGVGGAKIMVALSSGRRNIEFLIALMVVAVIVAIRVWNPYRTSRGDDYLASVRSLFANLRQRGASLQPGRATDDLLWLAALFGVAMLPSTTFPAMAYVWPRASASSSGSSCGSSCGSSGCGGGGGGGCGGCGS
jgi:uncharacterized protein (TIGR04222 family)